MTSIRPLEQTLSENLQWHKARIKFVARFLLALYAVRTVNLSILATSFSGRAQEASNYKRLQRFLREFELPYAELATFVVKLLGISGPYTLALDRTNWKIGRLEVNILMLGIVHRGIAFPVVWMIVPWAGNSDTDARITVLEIFIELFGAHNIRILLGDREFVGKRWFAFLNSYRIKFLLRLHKDTLVLNGRGEFVQAWRLFAHTGIQRMLVLKEARRMWGMDLFLSGCYLGQGEYLILVSQQYIAEPHIEYKKRWGIETLFGALKSRGFNLEDTRLQDTWRLSKLVALLTLAFTWAFIVGQWQATVKELKLKKHGYPHKSIFRLGLNMLSRLVTNLEHVDLLLWNKLIKLLSCS